MQTKQQQEQLVPSVLVRRKDGEVWWSRDQRDLAKLAVSDSSRLAVAESFVFEPDIERAYQRFSERAVARAKDRLRELDDVLDGPVGVRLDGGQVVVKLHTSRRFVDITDISRDTAGALEAITGSSLGADSQAAGMTAECFKKIVEELSDDGVLSPAHGNVRFGDFKRFWPFSRRFGFDRGAPVDRYYLNKFVQDVHPKVRGRCLEIGGSSADNRSYGFAVEEFRAVDLQPSKSQDFVGNVEDETLFEANTWDSILAFHVLEHCADPFAVVRNIHQWLRPGGHVFIIVPCAQRVHDMPGDYWRFMPDGLRLLFKSFAEVEISTYGNPLTVVSNYFGMSLTELGPTEMDVLHPDYPVIACAVGRK